MSIQQPRTTLLPGAAVHNHTHTSLTLPSKMLCELWLDVCVLHQRTTFLVSVIQPAKLRRRGATLSLARHSHGPWTSPPLSAHQSIEWDCMASQIETCICTCHTTTDQLIWQQPKCGTLGGSPRECRVDGQHCQDFMLSSLTQHPPFLEWPCQEQHMFSLTAFAPASDVSAPACRNGA